MNPASPLPCTLGLVLVASCAIGMEPPTEENAPIADLLTPMGKGDGVSQEFFLGGSYRVPVDRAELEPYASFGGYAVSVTREGDTFRMSYPFPKLFTGVAQSVSFEGEIDEEGALHFVSDAGDARCFLSDSAERLECDSQMPGLSFDAEGMDEVVSALSSSPEEVVLRREVGNHFITDPIGTLTLYFPQ